MSKIGLQKIMDTLLVKEFPGLGEIIVVTRTTDFEGTHYSLFVGISPAQLEEYGSDNIREYAKSLSQFVLNRNEKISILFYNPS